MVRRTEQLRSIAQRFLYRWWKSHGVHARSRASNFSTLNEVSEREERPVGRSPSAFSRTKVASPVDILQVPSGDVLSGKHSEEFLSRLPAAKAVIYRR